MRKALFGIALAVVAVSLAGATLWWWRGENRPAAAPAPAAARSSAPHIGEAPSATRDGHGVVTARSGQPAYRLAPATPPTPSAQQSTAPGSPAPPIGPVHPLLGQRTAAVWSEVPELALAADPVLRDVIRTVAASVPRKGTIPAPDDSRKVGGASPRAKPEETAPLARLVIDYPLDQSVFPPEIVPPTVLWHDPHPRADTWLVEFRFSGKNEAIYALVPGDPPPARPIDPRCVTKTNEIYRGTGYQASARAWKVDDRVWAAVKQRSIQRPATLTLVGFHSSRPAEVLSRGQITLVTSQDPVGAPIFYRDVPLAPSATEEGVIKPLSEAFLPLIAWRLRDVSQPESRLLLTDLFDLRQLPFVHRRWQDAGHGPRWPGWRQRNLCHCPRGPRNPDQARTRHHVELVCRQASGPQNHRVPFQHFARRPVRGHHAQRKRVCPKLYRLSVPSGLLSHAGHIGVLQPSHGPDPPPARRG